MCLRIAAANAIKKGRAAFNLERNHVFTNNESHPPMNKAQLTEEIQQLLGGDTSRRAAGEALDAVLRAITQGVRKHERVMIVGFGTFKLARRKERMGRNPKKPEIAVKIPASSTMRFTAAEMLKKTL